MDAVGGALRLSRADQAAVARGAPARLHVHTSCSHLLFTPQVHTFSTPSQVLVHLAVAIHRVALGAEKAGGGPADEHALVRAFVELLREERLQERPQPNRVNREV